MNKTKTIINKITNEKRYGYINKTNFFDIKVKNGLAIGFNFKLEKNKGVLWCTSDVWHLLDYDDRKTKKVSR